MKKYLLASIIIICIVIIFFITKSPVVEITSSPFTKFDSTKIDVGTMYEYYYSCSSQSVLPTDVNYIYIKKLNDIELLDIDLKDTLDLPYINKYVLNWKYMMLKQFRYKYIGNIKDLPLHYADSIDFSVDFQKKLCVSLDYGKEKNGLQNFNHRYKLESLPSYFYDYTDLMDLWFALRFYPFNKEMINVYIMHDGYNVKFDIKYDGKEEVEVPFGNVMCYKFELVPNLSFFMGLFHQPKKAYIWLTSEDSKLYMVKYINYNDQSSLVHYIEYGLKRIEKVSAKKWKEFKEQKIIQRLKAKENR